MARFFGWAWMVFALANLVDIAWRGRDAESLVAAAVLLLASGLAYVFALRPCIVADDTAVRLHNVLRDVRAPWPAVERVDGGEAVRVHAAGRRFRAFVLQTGPRARAREQAKADRLPDKVAEQVRGRTHTDFVAEQLRELAERNRGKDAPAEVTVAWSRPAIGALALPALFLAVSLIVALA